MTINELIEKLIVRVKKYEGEFDSHYAQGGIDALNNVINDLQDMAEAEARISMANCDRDSPHDLKENQ